MQLSISVLFWGDSVYHDMHLVVRGFSPSTFTWVGGGRGATHKLGSPGLGSECLYPLSHFQFLYLQFFRPVRNPMAEGITPFWFQLYCQQARAHRSTAIGVVRP